MAKDPESPSPGPPLPRSGRGRRLPAEVLTPVEIGKLIEACSRKSATGIRNRSLIVVLWRTGLRISEALALMPKDVDRAQGILHILRGKGDRQRSVALDPLAFGVLDRWLECRARLRIPSQCPVFCTLQKGPLQSAYVRALLPRLAREAGVEKRVHAHALRHTHACELMRERIPINLIQRQLGHANLAVTSRYLAHVSPPELVEAIQKRTWPDGVATVLEP